MNLFSQYIYRLKNCQKRIHYYFTAVVLFGLAQGIFMVLFNLYLQDLGLREDFVGRAISLQSLASVLILVPAGILSDRLGRKVMMLAGALGKGIFILLIAFTTKSSLLLLFAFGIGLSQSLTMVTTAPYLAENTSPDERMHLFSISWFFIMASSMGGNLLGGWITQGLETFFHWSPLASKRGAFLVAAIISFMVLLPLKKLRENHVSSSKKSHFIFALWHSEDRLTIFRFVLASLLLGLGAGLFVPYFNLYFTNRFHLLTGHVGTIMAMGQAFMALAMLFGPPLSQLIGRVASISLFQLSSVFFLLILSQTQLLPLAILSFLHQFTSNLTTFLQIIVEVP